MPRSTTSKPVPQLRPLQSHCRCSRRLRARPALLRCGLRAALTQALPASTLRHPSSQDALRRHGVQAVVPLILGPLLVVSTSAAANAQFAAARWTARSRDHLANATFAAGIGEVAAGLGVGAAAGRRRTAGALGDRGGDPPSVAPIQPSFNPHSTLIQSSVAARAAAAAARRGEPPAGTRPTPLARPQFPLATVAGPPVASWASNGRSTIQWASACDGEWHGGQRVPVALASGDLGGGGRVAPAAAAAAATHGRALLVRSFSDDPPLVFAIAQSQVPVGGRGGAAAASRPGLQRGALY